MTETALAIEYPKTKNETTPLVLQREIIIAAEKSLFQLINETSPNIKEIEDLLTNKGVDINCRDEGGMTPLLRLMQLSNNKNNLEEIVRVLLRHGPDANAKENYNGFTALHYVCLYYDKDNLIDIIRILVDYGVDIKEKARSGQTALHFLCHKKNLIEILRLAIQKGFDVVEKDSIYGSSVFHCVCIRQNENLIEVIKFLIESGVDVTHENEWSDCPPLRMSILSKG